MKRMIEGIINFPVESGGYEIIDDGDIGALIKFIFPQGYWPISLNSKPFSIMPGHINHGDENDMANWCFNVDGRIKWKTVAFNSDSINEDYGYNYISFLFYFNNADDRSAFLKELFGKDITNKEDITPFAVPVSMILVAFDGSTQY